MTNINFVFLRHGYGCHNAVPKLIQNQVVTKHKDLHKNDPELSQLGVDASLRNGCAVAKILTNLHKLSGNDNFHIQKMNIVGCSPLIRSMETAYYMTRRWKSPPNKIYVLPLLREIDEGSDNIYSKRSRMIMDTTPAYAMKPIQEQKEYLQMRGILKFFDFSYIEQYSKLRKEPGNINTFVSWFHQRFYPKLEWRPALNVLIITHAGVLNRYVRERFYNNSGFVLNTKVSPNTILYKDVEVLNKYLGNDFFKAYGDEEYTNLKYFCPTGRCTHVCKVASNSKRLLNNKVVQIDNECQLDDTENL
jgi:hypothetical protein